jgi:PAS domain S-box-containing protein
MTTPATPEAHIDTLQATEDLIAAESTREIADIAVETTTEVLQMSYASVHLHEEARDALVPVAWTDSVEEQLNTPPALGEGSLAWDAFRAGERRVYEELSSVPGVSNPDTPFQSEIVVPLGEHGVLLVSFVDETTVAATDRRLVGILGANVAEALDRVDRERSLRSYKQAVEHSGHAIVITDPAGTIKYVNPAFEDVTGYDADEAIGRNPRILKSGEHDRAFYEELWETITGGDVWRNTLVNTGKDGERFVVDQTIAPVLDDEGDVERFVAVNHDVTELKRRERNLRLLNQVLRHDVRNDLQLVVAYTELLADECDEDVHDDVEMVLESADHAVELTRTARDLADAMLADDRSNQRVSLRRLLDEEVGDVRSSYADATVTVDGTIPAVSVQADEMLGSVFRNVLKNAIQHNDKAVPEVTVSVTVDEPNAVVRIADNGPGISDDQKADIFAEGEQRLESQGSGLGLYLVRTLVDGYGGDVWIEDNDPEGAVFGVELPLAG